MAQSILVTGGCRSGKSRYATELALAAGAPLIYLATSPRADDPELERRILAHQAERAHDHWQTIEEQVMIADLIPRCPPGATILIDCLTLWVNNLLYRAETVGRTLVEQDVQHRCDQLIASVREHRGTVIMVTNEVGSGIVPDNPSARLFRDLAGYCNQCMARSADQVFLVSCGLPLKLKG